MNRRFIISGVAIIVVATLFLTIGRILVVKDMPESADIGIMLMGSKTDRALFTGDLYKRRLIQKIIVVGTSENQFTRLKNEGIVIQADTQIVRSIFNQTNIPDSNIVILNGPSHSTTDEARFLADYCSEHPEVSSVSIITSTYHSSRARKIFMKIFKDRNSTVRLYVPYNHYTEYDFDNWFKSKSGWYTTTIEASKYCYFYIWQRWHI